MRKLLVFIYLPASLLLILSGCAVRPRQQFDAAKVPPAVNYQTLDNWAAHPLKKDLADLVPNGLKDEQSSAQVDVFFLHPTTYTGSRRSERDWNASAADAGLNKKTEEGSIQYQASMFNGAGRVFAPRYRQAHYHTFFVTAKDSADARKALDLAYTDIEAAFDAYLKNWNNGRPFIIAGHSQGALHGMRLLREHIEGQSLEKQLVAAYVVGWPVEKNYFRTLKPCEKPDQTDCYCTWRTWEKKNGRRRANQPEVVCTNPLLWSTAEGRYAPDSLNLGGVVRPFETVRPALTDAEVWRGFLLARKPKFPGSFFFRRKNYHVGDLNLYYMNVRENARQKAAAFLKN
ncbi:MAG: DUF3089 domain-containing protein [Saprospiraceae bacterium]|nr:DUF3089 domain-containing protein [Saprospiraceae bacterium]